MDKQRIVEPVYIQQIFDQPGQAWTPDEHHTVKLWMSQEPQYQYLLHFTLLHLRLSGSESPEMAALNAEDTWHSFFAKNLDRVIRSYDPQLAPQADSAQPVDKRRRFWNYTLFCLERFCHAEGRKIRQHHHREQPLSTGSDQQEGDDPQPVSRGFDETPETLVMQAENRKDAHEKLLQAVQQLQPSYRQVLVLHYFEEQPLAAIAEMLGLTVANVKVRLFRARQMVGRALGNLGITSLEGIA